jgi:hypothetical protein
MLVTLWVSSMIFTFLLGRSKTLETAGEQKSRTPQKR